MSGRHIFIVGLLISACSKIEVPENSAIKDNDGDGYAVSDGDCDDADPAKNPADADGDGQSTCEGDCDDASPTTHSGAAEYDSSEACMTDDDGDGYGDAAPSTPVIAGTDCDDDDASLKGTGVDGDCDGWLAADDCDDEDASLGGMDTDSDCDGVLKAEDCDDQDSAKGVIGDCDGDGIATITDCDDLNPTNLDACFCEGRSVQSEGMLRGYYADCSEVSGSLYVSEVANIDGLSDVVSVSGDLEITYARIENLDGLAKLESVGSDLYVAYNSSLRNVDGLYGITTASSIGFTGNGALCRSFVEDLLAAIGSGVDFSWNEENNPSC